MTVAECEDTIKVRVACEKQNSDFVSAMLSAGYETAIEWTGRRLNRMEASDHSRRAVPGGKVKSPWSVASVLSDI